MKLANFLFIVVSVLVGGELCATDALSQGAIPFKDQAEYESYIIFCLNSKTGEGYIFCSSEEPSVDYRGLRAVVEHVPEPEHKTRNSAVSSVQGYLVTSDEVSFFLCPSSLGWRVGLPRAEAFEWALLGSVEPVPGLHIMAVPCAAIKNGARKVSTPLHTVWLIDELRKGPRALENAEVRLLQSSESLSIFFSRMLHRLPLARRSGAGGCIDVASYLAACFLPSPSIEGRERDV